MDYSKFQNDSFDVKEWINAAFKANRDPMSTEEYANMLARKLQIFAQEVTTVVEETSQKVTASMPRVIRDIEYVRQEATLLNDQMTLVKTDIHKVEQDTSTSMQSLLELDRIKTRLEQAAGALEVADCWTTLSSEVKEAMCTNDVDLISTKLLGMQESLTLLKSAPDYEEKKAELEDLKNHLEQAASSQLVRCFMAMDTEKARWFVRVFTALGRLPDLYTYYERCHRGSIEQAWSSSLGTSAAVELAGQSEAGVLPRALTQLYDLLLSTWHSQMRWCSQVFTSPTEVVCSLLVASLQNLKPSMSSSIAEHLSSTGDTLTGLFDLKQITDHFTTSLEAAVADYTKGDPVGQSVKDLVVQVFKPYVTYVDKYESLESSFLTKHLKAIHMTNLDVVDGISSLSESVGQLFTLANMVDSRCVKLTNGCGYPGLLKALKGLFTSYIREFKQALTSIQESSKAHALPVSEEDWTLFQQFLRIIQTCGDLLIGFEELNSTVKSNISASLRAATTSSDNASGSYDASMKSPFQDYPGLLLSSDEARLTVLALHKTVGGTGREAEKLVLLPSVQHELSLLSQDAHRMTFDVAFNYISAHLHNVWDMHVWVSASAGGSLTSDLPAFSLSPQEYITKVGQYLLTLPQHLEPFTPENNPAVYVAMKYGNLPYTSFSDKFDHISDLWLESVVGCTMHTYTEEILKITEITTHAARQLVTDIEYLCNVVDDLGFKATDSMSQVLSLLKTSADEFGSTSAGVPTRITNAVRAMRSIV